MTKRHQVFWSYEETQKAARLAQNGLKPTAIGKLMGRTGKSVLGRLQRMGLAGYSIPPQREKKPAIEHNLRKFSWQSQTQ